MSKAEQGDIREAFERYFIKKYHCTQCSFARNELRYKLTGWRRKIEDQSLVFYDGAGVPWRQCQVYDPQQWYLDKPDPGEGYRLLEKFPAEGLQPGDEWFEPSPFEVGWKVSHNERQADILWYRRRVEPNSPEKLDSCVDHLEVGKEYKLPSGQSIFVTEKGFEVV